MQKLLRYAILGLALIAGPTFAGIICDTCVFSASVATSTCTNTTPFVFNSGAGSVVVPTGCTGVIVEAWGGGGAGGGGSSTFGGGACGGGYDKSSVLPVTAGNSVFYSVGGTTAGTINNGTAGTTSWVNPAANSQPASNGAAASGGNGGVGISTGGQGCTTAGTGLIAGNVHFTGGLGGNGSSGATSGGGGGGGAGSTGNGNNGTTSSGSGAPGGAGGTPDGGVGGDGGFASGTAGTAPGGGGGACWTGGCTGSTGAAGRVRFTFSALIPINDNYRTRFQTVA